MIQIIFPHDFRVYDGTEIHEASSCCVAITRLGKKVVFYAPDKTAHHEVNHVTGKFLAKLLKLVTDWDPNSKVSCKTKH